MTELGSPSPTSEVGHGDALASAHHAVLGLDHGKTCAADVVLGLNQCQKLSVKARAAGIAAAEVGHLLPPDSGIIRPAMPRFENHVPGQILGSKCRNS